MKHALSMTVIAFVVGGWLQLVQANDTPSQQQTLRRENAYDGKWWSAANQEERSGFLNGAADGLVWIAHKKWVSHSIEWAVPQITKYYETHATSSQVLVVEVWRKLLSKAAPETPLNGGEVFTRPHGYYDGLYWRQSSESEHIGFLEGYMWCLRTQVQSPSETYSRPISYYAEKIDAYLKDFKAHPKGDHEAIADILARFRDNPRSTVAPRHSVKK